MNDHLPSHQTDVKCLRLEIAVTLIVGFLHPLLPMTLSHLFPDAAWLYTFATGIGSKVLFRAASVILCFFLVYYRDDSLKTLGIVFSFRSILVGLLLCLVLIGVNLAWSLIVPLDSSAPVASKTEQVKSAWVASQPMALGVVFVIVAALQEDVLCRAYLISRFEKLGKRAWVGMLLGVLVITIGHGGDGVTLAVAKLPTALILSGYYLWRRNLTPVIIAHILYNGLVM